MPWSPGSAARTRAVVLLLSVFVLLAAAPATAYANDPEANGPPDHARPNAEQEDAEDADDRRGGSPREHPQNRSLEPEDLTESGQDRPSRPAATPSPAASPPATPTPGPTARPNPIRYVAPPGPEIGWDISYPQCGGPYPESPAFAIVGVNGGRVYSANPCLGDGEHPSQLEWGGRDVELYINTGNPGPRLSSFWPTGQEHPRECATGWLRLLDTRDCAYVYGWNAAADSYRIALEAFISVGWLSAGATALPTDITWWLDVETANSWRFNQSLNVAALEGAVDYLESRGAHQIGFYSTPRLWSRIVGNTDAFADYPAWHGGARNLEDAQRRCATERAFTGGELLMVQWIQDGFDANIRCD